VLDGGLALGWRRRLYRSFRWRRRAHALCDAVLAAAGLGDLGAVFAPATALGGAHGVELLPRYRRIHDAASSWATPPYR